ncbi:glycosyl-4,4'-diaponeurosporenoate acyltransferase CrtO family protein [Hymenobacter cheonanensis]|uniref:glycosyl-4,4'-diaponeurosporenoate acyltransferase CrtO family protein n=1 Tax=Hymenobacter sp. CA2-7 TaxID=3063993 RepID=UPI002712C50A|nr:hypothetical protein [Hymenobacter sp. CA2-7]MDO7885513.1 hypothetical protein [Hymenobacter sp. CA2-7]
MPALNSQRGVPSAAVVACYNAVPSVLWSGLALGPLAVCCYHYVVQPWLWGFLAVSLSAYAWPAAWLRRLQLAPRAQVYRRLGVPGLGYFTQQGALVNRLLRRRYPNYRGLVGRRAVARLLSTTYQQERFHWAGLLFFLGVSIYVGAAGQLGWALGLTVLNVGYNLYPIWLQQYLRIRLGH